MDQVANLPAKQRAELFRETGSRRGIGSAVAEKDFWVCWVLKRLFADPALKSRSTWFSKEAQPIPIWRRPISVLP
jgi:hypothetical protein